MKGQLYLLLYRFNRAITSWVALIFVAWLGIVAPEEGGFMALFGALLGAKASAILADRIREIKSRSYRYMAAVALMPVFIGVAFAGYFSVLFLKESHDSYIAQRDSRGSTFEKRPGNLTAEQSRALEEWYQSLSEDERRALQKAFRGPADE